LSTGRSVRGGGVLWTGEGKKDLTFMGRENHDTGGGIGSRFAGFWGREKRSPSDRAVKEKISCWGGKRTPFEKAREKEKKKTPDHYGGKKSIAGQKNSKSASRTNRSASHPTLGSQGRKTI